MRAVATAPKSLRRQTRRTVRGLGIAVRTPRGTRMTQLVNMLLYVLVANPLVTFQKDIGLFTAIVIVISVKARADAHSMVFSVLLFVLLAAVYLVVASQGSRIQPLVAKLIDGRPVFDELGGLPSNVMNAALRISRDLKFALTSEDGRILDRLATLDQAITKSVLGERYIDREQKESNERVSRQELTKDWTAVWNRDVLGFRVGEATAKEAWGAPSYALEIVPFEFPRVASLVLPIFYIYQTLLIWLVYRTIGDSRNVLTLIQVAVGFSFVISIVIYLNCSQALKEIHIRMPVEHLPERFQDRARDLNGSRVVPTKVAVGPQYFAAVRGYFARAIAVSMTYNLIFQLAILAICLGGAVLVRGSVPGDLTDAYGKLALGLALIPIGMLVGYYLLSFLVEWSRTLLGAVLGAAAGALAPPALATLALGHLPHSSTEIVSSAVTGVVSAVATAIGVRAKSQIARD